MSTVNIGRMDLPELGGGKLNPLFTVDYVRLPAAFIKALYKFRHDGIVGEFEWTSDGGNQINARAVVSGAGVIAEDIYYVPPR